MNKFLHRPLSSKSQIFNFTKFYRKVAVRGSKKDETPVEQQNSPVPVKYTKRIRKAAAKDVENSAMDPLVKSLFYHPVINSAGKSKAGKSNQTMTTTTKVKSSNYKHNVDWYSYFAVPTMKKSNSFCCSKQLKMLQSSIRKMSDGGVGNCKSFQHPLKKSVTITYPVKKVNYNLKPWKAAKPQKKLKQQNKDLSTTTKKSGKTVVFGENGFFEEKRKISLQRKSFEPSKTAEKKYELVYPANTLKYKLGFIKKDFNSTVQAKKIDTKKKQKKNKKDNNQELHSYCTIARLHEGHTVVITPKTYQNNVKEYGVNAPMKKAPAPKPRRLDPEDVTIKMENVEIVEQKESEETTKSVIRSGSVHRDNTAIIGAALEDEFDEVKVQRTSSETTLDGNENNVPPTKLKSVENIKYPKKTNKSVKKVNTKALFKQNTDFLVRRSEHSVEIIPKKTAANDNKTKSDDNYNSNIKDPIVDVREVKIPDFQDNFFVCRHEHSVEIIPKKQPQRGKSATKKCCFDYSVVCEAPSVSSSLKRAAETSGAAAKPTMMTPKKSGPNNANNAEKRGNEDRKSNYDIVKNISKKARFSAEVGKYSYRKFPSQENNNDINNDGNGNNNVENDLSPSERKEIKDGSKADEQSERRSVTSRRSSARYEKTYIKQPKKVVDDTKSAYNLDEICLKSNEQYVVEDRNVVEPPPSPPPTPPIKEVAHSTETKSKDGESRKMYHNIMSSYTKEGPSSQPHTPSSKSQSVRKKETSVKSLKSGKQNKEERKEREKTFVVKKENVEEGENNNFEDSGEKRGHIFNEILKQYEYKKNANKEENFKVHSVKNDFVSSYDEKRAGKKKVGRVLGQALNKEKLNSLSSPNLIKEKREDKREHPVKTEKNCLNSRPQTARSSRDKFKSASEFFEKFKNEARKPLVPPSVANKSNVEGLVARFDYSKTKDAVENRSDLTTAQIRRLNHEPPAHATKKLKNEEMNVLKSEKGDSIQILTETATDSSEKPKEQKKILASEKVELPQTSTMTVSCDSAPQGSDGQKKILASEKVEFPQTSTMTASFDSKPKQRGEFFETFRLKNLNKNDWTKNEKSKEEVARIDWLNARREIESRPILISEPAYKINRIDLGKSFASTVDSKKPNEKISPPSRSEPELDESEVDVNIIEANRPSVRRDPPPQRKENEKRKKEKEKANRGKTIILPPATVDKDMKLHKDIRDMLENLTKTFSDTLLREEKQTQKMIEDLKSIMKSERKEVEVKEEDVGPANEAVSVAKNRRKNGKSFFQHFLEKRKEEQEEPVVKDMDQSYDGFVSSNVLEKINENFEKVKQVVFKVQSKNEEIDNKDVESTKQEETYSVQIKFDSPENEINEVDKEGDEKSTQATFPEKKLKFRPQSAKVSNRKTVLEKTTNFSTSFGNDENDEKNEKPILSTGEDADKKVATTIPKQKPVSSNMLQPPSVDDSPKETRNYSQNKLSNFLEPELDTLCTKAEDNFNEVEVDEGLTGRENVLSSTAQVDSKTEDNTTQPLEQQNLDVPADDCESSGEREEREVEQLVKEELEKHERAKLEQVERDNFDKFLKKIGENKTYSYYDFLIFLEDLRNKKKDNT